LRGISSQSPTKQEVQASLGTALAEVDGLREQLGGAQVEIRPVRAKLDALVQRIFGKESEQLNDAQLQLMLQEEAAPGAALGKASDPLSFETQPLGSGKEAHRKTKRSPRLPEQLSVVEEVLVPEVVRHTPLLWRRIAEEVSEQLDFEPAWFWRRRLVRPKYVHRLEVDAVPLVAPRPDGCQERCIAVPGLLAQILVAKYPDHLPLYRLKSIYCSRHQVWLPRQTMVRWVEFTAEWLEPIYKEIRREVFSNGYVQVDETPLRDLDPGYGKVRQGYFWTAHRQGGDTLYHWETSGAAKCLGRVVPVDFKGIMQTDVSEAYPCYARSRAEKSVWRAVGRMQGAAFLRRRRKDRG
jgi:transposase